VRDQKKKEEGERRNLDFPVDSRTGGGGGGGGGGGDSRPMGRNRVEMANLLAISAS